MVQTRLSQLLLLAVIGGSHPASSHARPDDQALLDWFVGQVRNNELPPELTDRVRLRWVREFHSFPSNAEMERLKREVPGHPDHPERNDLERFLRHQRGEPTVKPRTAWAVDANTWRLSEDLVGPLFKPNAYWDKVVTPTHAFSLCHDTLTVMDPRDGYPPGQDLASLSGELFGNLFIFLMGGLSQLQLNADAATVQAFDGQGWSIKVGYLHRTPGQSGTVLVRGRWSAGDNRGFIEDISRIATTGSPQSSAKTEVLVTATDWTRVLDTGVWLAGRVTMMGADGRIDKVYRFQSAEREDPATFRRMFEIPERGGVDPFRGTVLPISVFDMRTGKHVLNFPDGRQIVDDIPSGGLSPAAGTSAQLRRVGWAIAAVLVAAMVALAGWRRHRSKLHALATPPS